MNKVAQGVIVVAALMTMGCGIWTSIGNAQGNRLVDEANAAIDQGNKLSTDAGVHYKKLINDETIKTIAENRSKLKETIDQAASLYEKSAEQYRLGAAKFDEASGQKVDSKVSEYWKLKSEQLQKLAAAKLALRKIVLALADESVTDIPTFNKQVDAHIKDADQNHNAAKESATKADKVKEDNKSKFSS